jgi:serine/threonine-protein kinase
MSPEQCHGLETSASSDQYSVGVLAYELLTGLPPFTGTPIELQIAHMQDTPVPILDRRSELSPELAGAVMRMLLKNPEERWPSLRELLPIFSRGLDVLGAEPRNELIEMVKSGAPRGHSFPATPVSPEPRSGQRAPASRGASRENHQAGEPTAVTSSERDAPTRISAPHRLVGVLTPAAELMSSAPVSVPAGDTPAATIAMAAPVIRRRSMKTTVMASTAVVLVAAAVLMLRAGKSSAPLPQPAAAVVAAPITDQLAQLFGDSAAVGPGPASTAARGRGKVPREVTVDAVALLQLTVPSGRIGVGDTVHLGLRALDDAGSAVTTPQIVWTTSNPKIARFSGPGELIAAGEGKATVTVSAGSASTARDLTVLAKRP